MPAPAPPAGRARRIRTANCQLGNRTRSRLWPVMTLVTAVPSGLDYVGQSPARGPQMARPTTALQSRWRSSAFCRWDVASLDRQSAEVPPCRPPRTVWLHRLATESDQVGLCPRRKGALDTGRDGPDNCGARGEGGLPLCTTRWRERPPGRERLRREPRSGPRRACDRISRRRVS